MPPVFTMPARIEPTHGSSAKRRALTPPPPSAEDILADPGPPTDDTPTIISRHAPAQSHDDPRTVRGRRLAHFELIEPIGVGGMAAVLRARDTQLDRAVALKVLPPEMALDPENVKRFHQEARSAAKLDHENIARVFFCGEDQRLHFIAFEFVEGENLRAVLERRGRLPVAEALHYMIQVAAGLAHAAERGVVHRDIKPSNIIITPSGRAKLVDMGLARSLVRKGEDDLTQSGVTLGTFDYISPEQALEPREADTRSDIYSLGCTFYHALTGRPPVPEGTAAKKLHHHQHVKPSDPRDLTPGLPVEVVQALDRMMAKRPEDRFQTPEHLMQALLAVAKRLGVADVPDGLTVEAALPGPPSASPLLWAGLAAALVVAAVLLSDGVGPAPHRAPRPKHNGGGTPVPGTKDAVVGKKDDEKPPVKPPDVDAKPVVIIVDAETRPADLARTLEMHADAARIELLLDATLDLSDYKDQSGLLVRARQQITVRSRDPASRQTIRLKYDGRPPGEDRRLVALTLSAPRVTVEDVKFVIDATLSDIKPRALHLPTGSATVSRSVFVQARPPRGVPHAAASIQAGGRDLTIRECAFLGYADAEPYSGPDAAQAAILIDGPAHVVAEQSVFGPHASAFRIERGDGVRVTLRHSSALLPGRRSALFDIAAGASADLNVSQCLAGRLHGDTGDAVLVRDATAGRVRWTGSDNVWHDLDGYWVQGDDLPKARWTDFRRLAADEKIKDDSRLALASPWKTPPAAQRTALEAEDLAAAFAVALAPRVLRSQRSVVGVRTILGTSWVPADLPDPGDEAGRRTLVVEKDADGEERNGVFGTLEAAVRAARLNDVVAIRHDGVLDSVPLALNTKALGNLLVRPARRCRPVLELAVTSETDNPALFKLYDGRLRLEGLEIRLKTDGPAGQSAVTLLGDCECVLSGCVITMARATDATGVLSVAALPPPPKGPPSTMMMAARDKDKGPRLVLENCLVRGDGDLLAARATRPAALELTNTLAALTGSVYTADFDGGETAPQAAHKLALVMKNATAYLGGPLVRVKVIKGVRAMVPVECDAARSLFLPAAAKLNMIHLEAPEGEDRDIRERFKWTGDQNAYGKFSSLLAQPAGEEMMMMMTAEQWKRATNDGEGKFRVEPVKSPAEGATFPRMLPEDFAAPREAPEAGAPHAKLPQPRP